MACIKPPPPEVTPPAAFRAPAVALAAEVARPAVLAASVEQVLALPGTTTEVREETLRRARTALRRARRRGEAGPEVAALEQLVGHEHAAGDRDRAAVLGAAALGAAEHAAGDRAAALGAAAMAAVEGAVGDGALEHLWRHSEGLPESASLVEDLADRKVRTVDLEPSRTYRHNGYEWQTDQHGQIAHVEGWLRNEAGTRDAYRQRLAGKLGDPSDEGGHLIATRFGGFGAGPNVVPQSFGLNHGDWWQMEDAWAADLAAGERIRVEIDLACEDPTSYRPTALIVRYWVGDTCHYRAFLNENG